MQNDLQSRFFAAILSKYTKKVEAIEELADLLAVGKDAVYRRFRGDTLLSPNELSLLAQKYNISLDSFVYRQSDTVFFTYNPFAFRINNFEDYLSSFGEDLEQIYQLPETKIFYASSEIPIFLYCFFPELIAFKLYIWGRTAWDFDYLEKRPFDFELIPYPVYQRAEKILEYYTQLPSTELWNVNIVDNTLSQIEYYATSGSFAKLEDALILCDKLEALIRHLKLMAEKGYKLPLDNKTVEGRGKFELFHNEMVFTNNTILVDTVAGKAIYTSFGNPNFLKSTDQRICLFMEEWIKKVMSKAQLISTQGEKSRDWFFNRLSRKIALTKNKLEMYIEGEM